MMKQRIAGLSGMVLGMLLIAGVAWAAPQMADGFAADGQAGWTPPPTIISFSSDIEAISLADAEAGETVARLSWQTVGVGPDHRVVLTVYRVNRWEPLPGEEAAQWPATGAVDVVITHSLTFGPPAYSLVIADAAGQTLDQRVLIIPYDLPEDAPAVRIDAFSTTATTVAGASLADGTARVAVSWAVSNRTPTSNLVFEQVLEGGAVVPVDLPRSNLWVPSIGEGVVAPVQTVAGQPVRIRLRVVDLVDGRTIDEQTLPPIPVIQGTVPAVQPSFFGGASPLPPVAITSFEAAPDTISRGVAVTVTWDVQNAAAVEVWLLEPGGALGQRAPETGPQGSWTVTLPDVYVDRAVFTVFASDAAGNAVEQTVTVDIICPYTYFFDHAGETLSCPRDEAITVQAAYQRFERGVMMWRADTSDIFVLFDNGLANRFKDSWQGEPITFAETPPEGLFKPDRGFGRVWVDNPQVRAELGWAVTMEEGYIMRVQQSGDVPVPRLYLTWPDDTVIYLAGNTWGTR